MFCVNAFSQNYIKDGKTFTEIENVKALTTIKTDYLWKDKFGKLYSIYLTKNNKFFHDNIKLNNPIKATNNLVLNETFLICLVTIMINPQIIVIIDSNIIQLFVISTRIELVTRTLKVYCSAN